MDAVSICNAFAECIWRTPILNNSKLTITQTGKMLVKEVC